MHNFFAINSRCLNHRRPNFIIIGGMHHAINNTTTGAIALSVIAIFIFLGAIMFIGCSKQQPIQPELKSAENTPADELILELDSDGGVVSLAKMD